MKLSLQLKLGQQLTMTPQLQQAIRLLQLSTVELQHEIQQALESNPMLEMDEETGEDTSTASSNDPPAEGNGEAGSDEWPADGGQEAGYDTPGDDAPDGDWPASGLPDEPAVDSQWEDIYLHSGPAGTGVQPAGEAYDLDANNSESASLQDYLYWQLNLTPMSEGDRVIATALIEAIDANGKLSSSLESIHAGLRDELDVEEDEVLAVLHRIQQFDPVGVGYRDLQECLSLQLQHLEADTPGLANARRIVADFLPQLASHDYKAIMKKLKLGEDELRQALKLILTLNPRPGADIAPSETTYVVPDVFVYKENNRWKLELNPETAPRLRINPDYAAMVHNGSGDGTFLKDSLQEAKWFLKSLQSRNETLLKVATTIVEHQQDFLEHGEEAMKPLVLHNIAEAVDMHESTISRVTTQKYMHTPRGVFELKYFFSSHVNTTNGGECSSTAIRALIKKLVAAENPRKPLSDSKISELLAEQGINVARRTIAKYRESLSIAPSNERKQL